MTYGFKSRYRKNYTGAYRRRRLSGFGVSKTAYRKKTARYTRKPRYSTVSYSRNSEKKYCDRAMAGIGGGYKTGIQAGLSHVNGQSILSLQWESYNFGLAASAVQQVSNDLLKGLETGTTARTRIGNKVKAQYIKGSITMTAAAIQMAAGATLPGEEVEKGDIANGTQTNLKYARTTLRVAIVKDTQVNSLDAMLPWEKVFDSGYSTGWGVHSELNIDNMGRFVILDDKTFQLDGDDPMKTYKFNITGSQIGTVRYNGPSATALTDKGIYVIWSAFMLGQNNQLGLTPPAVVLNSRFCFTDD